MEQQQFVAAGTSRNVSTDTIRIDDVALTDPTGLDSHGALHLGDSFTMDLVRVPVAPSEDELLARVWQHRSPADGTVVAAGKQVQLGVLVTVDADEKTGQAGPVQVRYTAAGHSYVTHGTFQYRVCGCEVPAVAPERAETGACARRLRPVTGTYSSGNHCETGRAEG